MRTTIDLPESLVDEAVQLSPQKTKTAVIIQALEEYVRKIRLQELKKFKGTVDINLDLATLRKRT